MPSINDSHTCATCSQALSNYPQQCTHCFSNYCQQCLVKHHHIEVKQEFENMIQNIDEILKIFLYHAHSQTEWTEHLTKDRKKLQYYVQFIENSLTHYPVYTLPKFQWVYHVQRLIAKMDYAINEDCFKIL